MTFKKSSEPNGTAPLKLFVSHLKNRPWVVAIHILVAVVFGLIIPAIYLGGCRMRQEAAGFSGAMLAQRLYEDAAGWLLASSVLGMGTILLLAAVTGIESFSYLFKRQAIDFYDSQPMSASKRFVLHYFSGIVLFAAVFGVSTILEISVAALCGCGYRDFYMAIAVRFLRFAAYYAGTYSMAVLAAVLSGNAIIATMLFGFLTVLESAYRLNVVSGMEHYFATFYPSAYTSWYWPRSLPLSYYAMHIGELINVDVSKNGLPYDQILKIETDNLSDGVLPGLIIAVVLCVIAFIAFKKRPRETAGKGLCFPVMESFVKISTAVCIGIDAGLIADTFFNSTYRVSAMSVLVVLVCAAIVGLVAESIYAYDVAKALKRWWQIPVSFVLAIAFIFVFKFDVTGFDSYIPSKDEVESAALFPESSFTYTYISEEELYNDEYLREDYLSRHMILTDIDAVEKVAQTGMKTQKDIAYKTQDLEENQQYPEDAQRNWGAYVLYRLKNNKVVWRSILLPYDINTEDMDALTGSEEYKSASFNLDNMESVLEDRMKLTDNKPSLRLAYDNPSNNVNKDAKISDIKALVEAYKKDTKDYCYSYARENICIGSIGIYYTDGANYGREWGQSLPVYEGFSNTIALLNELELYRPNVVDAEKVGMIAVHLDRYNDEGQLDDPREIRYTDADEIKALLDVVDITSYSGEWIIYDSSEGYQAVVIEKRDMDSEFENVISERNLYDENYGVRYSIWKDDAPEFLNKSFE